MSDVPQKLPPKKDVALALLEGQSLYVHLDSRRPGVAVPKWLMGQPRLVLQLGLNMVIPIPDLKVDDEGITCTLSFNRTPFWCNLPWSAVWALVGEDNRGMLWPDSIPPEVAAEAPPAGSAQTRAPGAAAPAAAKPAKKPRAALRAVETSATPAPPRRARRPREAAAARPPVGPVPVEKAPEPARLRPAPAPAPALVSTEQARTATPQRKSAPSHGDKGEKKPKRELPPYLRVIK